MASLVSKILFVFISSWLWRVAGRGGFSNSLWLRRIVVPYMAYLLTGHLIASLIFALSLTLPITLVGNDIRKNLKNGWIFLLALIHGLALSLFYYPDLKTMFFSALTTSFLYTAMILLVENFRYEEGENMWYLFEYGCGCLFSLAIVLSV